MNAAVGLKKTFFFSDGILPESIFARYVIPKLVELFQSRLIHVRLVLLENFSKFVHLFEKSILNDMVLPEVGKEIAVFS